MWTWGSGKYIQGGFVIEEKAALLKLTKNTLYILGLLSISLCNRKTRFNLGGTMETVDAVCQRYGVPILSSLTDNDPAWVYDGSTDRLYQDPSVTDKVRYYHVLPNEPSLQTSQIRNLFSVHTF